MLILFFNKLTDIADSVWDFTDQIEESSNIMKTWLM